MEVIKKILRLENMLRVCLVFFKSELNYAYKLHAYKKKSVSLKNTSSGQSLTQLPTALPLLQ